MLLALSPYLLSLPSLMGIKLLALALRDMDIYIYIWSGE
nr:hypothetical protein Q903MT_gene4413 [Picea sitchensis]